MRLVCVVYCDFRFQKDTSPLLKGPNQLLSQNGKIKKQTSKIHTKPYCLNVRLGFEQLVKRTNIFRRQLWIIRSYFHRKLPPAQIISCQSYFTIRRILGQLYLRKFKWNLTMLSWQYGWSVDHLSLFGKDFTCHTCLVDSIFFFLVFFKKTTHF